jgi:hypothetical protein
VVTSSSIFPDEGKKPKFSQIFVFDQDNELNNRFHQAMDPHCISHPTLQLLQTELKSINPLVKSFKSAADIFNANPTKKLKMVFKAKGSVGAQKKHQNPNIPDVVIVAPGDQTEHQDVVLYRRKSDAPNQNETMRINENHLMYDPAAYSFQFIQYSAQIRKTCSGIYV